MNVALYGQHVADKMEAVDAALEAVNEKHKDYFAGIKSKLANDWDPEKTSSLHEFTVLQWNNVGATLGILPELREDIAEEARQAFASVVGTNEG